MKQTKRAATLALAAMLALSLAACGGENADAAVTAALEKLKGAASMDAKMEVTIAYAGAEGSGDLTVTNTMSVTMFTEPLKMKADVEMKMRSGEDEYTQALTTYAIQEGGGVTQYATNGTDWAKKTAASADLEQYDARSSLVRYLEKGAGYKEAGTEQVEGADAAKYTGTVSGEALVELLDDTGSLGSISAMSADQQAKIRENLKGLPPLTVSVWVDSASGCPARFEMDMSKLLADMEANIDETLGHPDLGDSAETPEIASYIVRMTLSNFDAATPFELPAEAAAAAEVG